MKMLAEYSTDKGTLWMGHGDQYFVVVCHNLVSPGSWRIREFGRLTQEGALEKFEEMRAGLDGRTYVKPKCKYYSSRRRICKSDNCPAKLGGAAFWEIFSNSCCYKTR